MKMKHTVKKNKKKSTTIKVANKKGNKFVRSAKYKKLKRKQKEFSSKQVSNLQDDNDDEVEDGVVEEDIEFYSNRLSAFTAEAIFREQKKNRKRQNEDKDGSSHYEKRSRTTFDVDDSNIKHMLPIKENGRVIPQSLKLQYGDDSSPCDAQNDENLSPMQAEDGCCSPNHVPELLSATELAVYRKSMLLKRKHNIAELSMAVIESPINGINKLKELRKMLGERDPALCLTVRRLVMMSLCEVFRDIIPAYRIRLPSQQEREQKMKQETRQLVTSEESLLHGYKVYLEFLEFTINGKSFKKSQRMTRLGFCDVVLSEDGVKELKELAVQCMCSLLMSHSHFNYRSDIIMFLIPLMAHANTKISDTVCTAVCDIFATDTKGHVCLEIVRGTAKFVKGHKFHVLPKVLQTLLSLNIKEVNLDKSAVRKKIAKKDKYKLSRRERKRLKQTAELEKDLMETKATHDKDERLRLHTEIVEAMFTMFFNVLKQEEKSPLLPVVLECLTRFAHLISVDFFHDLYSVFTKLMESEVLSQLETLYCIQTAFCMLRGQGAALNIDPTKFYTYLYQAMECFHAGCRPQDVCKVVQCIESAIIHQKKQVTQQRVMAFLKRLTTMALHQMPAGAASYLSIARCFVSLFPFTDQLYDQESQGSGVYMPYLSEPEHCHASSSVLWELHSLKKHYHPQVRRLSHALLNRNPTEQSELSKMTPGDVFSHIDNEDIFSKSIPATVRKKSR